MSVSTFRAFCAKGHDRIDFQGADGAKAWGKHIKTEHGRSPRKAGAGYAPGYDQPKWYTHGVAAPGWRNGEIEKPTPWKAPKTPKDWEANLSQLATQYADEILESSMGTPDGIYRYDNGSEPPYGALPANVRTILEAVVSRGERWAVRINRWNVVVTLARSAMEQGNITVHQGKVRICSRTQITSYPQGLSQTTLAKVREMFGPDWTPNQESTNQRAS